MDNNHATNVGENIKNFFDNISFSEKYNFDIWITIVTIAIVLYIALYYYVLNTIQSYRPQWQANKCNPYFMAAASIINPKDSESDSDFARNNLDNCLNNLNRDINDNAEEPINEMFNIFSGIFAFAASVSSNIASFIVYLFNLLVYIFQQVIERLQLIILESNFIFITIKSFMDSIIGVLAHIYYTLIILADSIKLSFYILSLSWLSVAVLPSVVAVAISSIMTLVTYVIAYVISGYAVIPIFGWPMAPLVPGLWFLYSGCLLTFIIAFAFFIFVTILYIVFKTFAENVLEKTLEPVTTNEGPKYEDPPAI